VDVVFLRLAEWEGVVLIGKLGLDTSHLHSLCMFMAENSALFSTSNAKLAQFQLQCPE